MRRTISLSLSALSLASAAAAQDNDLLVFDYSGFESPEFHADYVEKHSASPQFAFFGEEDEAFQKLVSGFTADVAHICAGSVSKWQESGLLKPWDISQISAWEDLNKDLVSGELDAGEEVYFLPTDYGSTAIAYNPDLVAADEVASLSVFQDPAYTGKLTLPDNVDDAYALAYLATGLTDWSSVTDAQFTAASEWLRAVHPLLRTYWVDPAELSQLLASGEVTIAWAWNETYPAMAEEGRPIAFERNTTEGSSLWLCGYVKLDGKGDEAKAYDYVNAVLSPSASAALLADGFGQANQAAMSAFGEEELEAAGLGDVDVPLLAQVPMPQELRDRQAAEFEKIKAGF